MTSSKVYRNTSQCPISGYPIEYVFIGGHVIFSADPHFLEEEGYETERPAYELAVGWCQLHSRFIGDLEEAEAYLRELALDNPYFERD